MDELAFVTVFNRGSLCVEKKSTKRQKFKKPNDFRQAHEVPYFRTPPYFFILDLLSYCACYYFTLAYIHFKFFKRKSDKISLRFEILCAYKRVFAIR